MQAGKVQRVRKRLRSMSSQAVLGNEDMKNLEQHHNLMGIDFLEKGYKFFCDKFISIKRVETLWQAT